MQSHGGDVKAGARACRRARLQARQALVYMAAL